MSKKYMAASLLMCTLGCSSAFAAGTNLLEPVDSSISVLNGNGQYMGVAGAWDNLTPPSWNIAQWGTPVELYPESGSSSGWSINNEYARVKFYPQYYGAHNVYELAQANIGSLSECHHERDLFISPYGSDASRRGGTQGMTRSARLSQLGSIWLSVGLAVPYNKTYSDCGSQGYWDYSQYVYSVILNSTSGQTLFYQVNLGHNSTPKLKPTVSWCPSYENSSNQEFCLDDDVRNFTGGTHVLPNQNVFNQFDFLPRVAEVISKGHTKIGQPSVALDDEIGNWTVGAIYLGSILQGKVVDTTRWYNIGLETYSGGNFCNGSHAIQWSCGQGKPQGTGWNYVGSACYQRNTQKSCF